MYTNVTIICPTAEFTWVPTRGWLSNFSYLKISPKSWGPVDSLTQIYLFFLSENFDPYITWMALKNSHNWYLMQLCRFWMGRVGSEFGSSVNPISTRGGRLCPPPYYQPPGFSDFSTALDLICRMHNYVSYYLFGCGRISIKSKALKG